MSRTSVRWPGRGDPITVAEVLTQERDHLLPLPEHRFEHDLVKTVRSGKTPYVRFDLNDYSIPPDQVRRTLTLIASEERVRITVAGGAVVGNHRRSYDRDCVIESKAHLDALRDRKRHAHELRGRDRLTDACPTARRFLQEVLDRDMSIRPQTAHLNRLLDRYGPEALASAIEIAIDRGAITAASVDQILDQQTRANDSPPRLETVLPDDRRVRELRVKNHDLEPYDALASTEDDDESE